MRANRKKQLGSMTLPELRQVLIRDIRKIPTSRVKRTLERYRYCQQRIDSNLDQIQVLRSRMQKVTVTYHDAPGGGTGADASVQLAQILKLEAQLKSDTTKMQDELTLVRFLIDSLDNVLERQVLDLRYVRCWRDWGKIADEVNYTASHVKNVHGVALRKLVPLVEQYLRQKR